MKISEIAKWCMVSEIHLPSDVRQQTMGIKPCHSEGVPEGLVMYKLSMTWINVCIGRPVIQRGTYVSSE